MRYIRPFFAAALFATLAACTDDAPTAAVPREEQPALAMNATSARVVGYFPTWAGSVGSVRYDKLTHIHYAFVDVLADGGLTGVAMSGDARLTSLVQQAHAAGVKVLISVGGWNDGDDSGFVQMAASSTARAAFVGNIATFARNYGLDGVDIDWEYPSTEAESASYSTLMSELSAALRAEGRMLTAAVPATAYYGQWIRSDVFGYVDYLFLMAYDRSTAPHSPYSFAGEALDYWRDVRGLPQARTVLGLPFYGRDAAGGYKGYNAIVRADAAAPTKDESGGFHYNGTATIKQKTTLGLQRGSGVGIWEITQDSAGTGISLLDAIHEGLNAPVPPYDPAKVVYDDALNGWNNWSWDVSLNLAATSPVYQGSKSVAATYTAAWGGIYLRHGSGVGTSGLTRLEFYVHGGTGGGQDLRVKVGDVGGWYAPTAKAADHIAEGSIAAGAWRKVSIPLSALGVTTNPVARIQIQDGAGTTQPTFYLDHIRFVP